MPNKLIKLLMIMLLSILSPVYCSGTAFSLCLPGGIQELPPETRVLAVGAYKGRSLDWRLDPLETKGSLMQVAVNSPGQPVFLVLSAYDPMLWQIGWTEGTEFAGVLALGYHQPAVVGLPVGVPLRISAPGPCPRFEKNDFKGLETVQNLTGRPADQLVEANGGAVVVGDMPGFNQTVLTAGYPERSRLDHNWPAEKVLLDALRDGLIKPASADDYVRWAQAGNADLLNVDAKIEFPYWVAGRFEELMTKSFLVSDPRFVPPSRSTPPNFAGVLPTYVFFLPPGYPKPNQLPRDTIYLLLDNGGAMGKAPWLPGKVVSGGK